MITDHRSNEAKKRQKEELTKKSQNILSYFRFQQSVPISVSALVRGAEESLLPIRLKNTLPQFHSPCFPEENVCCGSRTKKYDTRKKKQIVICARLNTCSSFPKNKTAPSFFPICKDGGLGVQTLVI